MPMQKRDLQPMTVRLPREVLDRLHQRARENTRSANSEIVVILAKALEAEREKAA